MEALTDREHGMMDLDSGDEAQLPAGQPAQEASGDLPLSADPEACGLPLSQSSGSELPASHPQPFSAQEDTDTEEEMIIEDYDSEGT